MEHIEIIREPIKDCEVGVTYRDKQEVRIRAYGDTLPEAFENLSQVMRKTGMFDHTETESF